MVCPIQKNIVPLKITVQITLGVNRQHNFTSLLKKRNTLADTGNDTNTIIGNRRKFYINNYTLPRFESVWLVIALGKVFS